METANETDCLSALERAVHADPEEPTYRFLAGAFRLKTGDFQGALTHFRTGLEHEHAPYRRGLLLLWASRSADLCKQTGEARAYRQELLSIDHSQLEKPQKSARREAKRAYSARKLRHMEFNLALADVL
jgi:tetratricopeptide (TPR) repeat protein